MKTVKFYPWRVDIPDTEVGEEISLSHLGKTVILKAVDVSDRDDGSGNEDLCKSCALDPYCSERHVNVNCCKWERDDTRSIIFVPSNSEESVELPSLDKDEKIKQQIAVLRKLHSYNEQNLILSDHYNEYHEQVEQLISLL